METRTWIGIALAFWLWGFLARLIGGAVDGRYIEVPRWVALLLFSRTQQIATASLVFQMMGLLMLAYGLTLAPLMPNQAVEVVVGFVLPAVGTKFILDYLSAR
jgi:hypothetical protein